MLWDQLEVFQKTITCPRLAEAWRTMLLTRSAEDCEHAAYWAEYGTQTGIIHFRLASRAADLARAEARLREILSIVTAHAAAGRELHS